VIHGSTPNYYDNIEIKKPLINIKEDKLDGATGYWPYLYGDTCRSFDHSSRRGLIGSSEVKPT